MRCLVIGYGSIGRRHAEILKSLGCQVSLVTSQNIDDYPCYSTIEKALEEVDADYTIIANPTYLHHSALLALVKANYKKVVLVEKPLFSQLETLPANNIAKVLVAYNLRFHELLIEAKKILRDQEMVSFTTYVGQYLPTWRKDRDYRDCYSTKKEWGGGVLRELSHELDYTTWFCGPCIEVAANGGHFSALEMSSDDAYSILMKTKACPMVTVHLNCLDRLPRRHIIINTHQCTINIDLVNGILNIDGATKAEVTHGGTQSYMHQHQAMLNNDFSAFCSYEEGVSIMKLIETIETASETKKWITL